MFKGGDPPGKSRFIRAPKSLEPSFQPGAEAGVCFLNATISDSAEAEPDIVLMRVLAGCPAGFQFTVRVAASLGRATPSLPVTMQRYRRPFSVAPGLKLNVALSWPADVQSIQVFPLFLLYCH